MIGEHDPLYEISNVVLVENTDLVDVLRITIAIISGMTATLLAKLYLAGKTGRMNLTAGIGAVSAYVVIAWAQIVALSNPLQPHEITILNMGVLLAVSLSLVGTFRAMHVNLFRKKK